MACRTVSRTVSKTWIAGRRCESRAAAGGRQFIVDEYAMGGIRLQSHRNICRHQVYCFTNGSYAMYVIE
jgi:hypothetical protein